MKKSDLGNRQYAAGVVDSDGCIQVRIVRPRKETNTISYQLQISVTQIDGDIVDFLYGVFGGSVYYIDRKDPTRQNMWRWEVVNNKAADFLKKITPFLRIKKSQGELGIRFYTNHKKAVNQFKKQNPKDLEFYQWCYIEMQRLKTIHNVSRAAATTNQTDPQGML